MECLCSQPYAQQHRREAPCCRCCCYFLEDLQPDEVQALMGWTMNRVGEVWERVQEAVHLVAE